MLENKFKTDLIRTLKNKFPECMVVHLDPNETQGIPDLLVLIGKHWFALEGKRTKNASKRPNQEYYVNLMNQMSYGAFICPENKEEILNEIEQTLRA